MLHPTDQPARRTADRQWWAMTSADVVAVLDVDVDQGLTDESAADRLGRFGTNELAHQPGPSLLRRLIAQFTDPLVGLLLAAIVVSLIAWAFAGDTTIPVEATVIALIVVANAWIGVWQEGKATRAVDALRRLTAANSTVVRSGRTIRVPTASLVPGDIVLLAEGDMVGCDGRVVEAASVEVNEAPLTGESAPVAKLTGAQPSDAPVGERTDMVLSGTSIVRGRCRVVATATGQDTEVGRIATLLDETETEPTPLQRQVERLGRTLGLAVIVLAVIVVVAIVVTSDVDTAEEGFDALLVAVSLAVAAVPEGLPAIMTVVLALGVQRMSRRNAIVKRLVSVETLGSASVICTDKTGTLTRNEMTVVRVATASGESTFTGVGYSPEGSLRLGDGVDRTEVEELVSAAATATDATLESHEGEWIVNGDPTEIALVVVAAKAADESDQLHRFHEEEEVRIDEIPFDADRKLMSVLVDLGSEWHSSTAQRIVQYTKGAPDVLLDRCVLVSGAGLHVALDGDRRAQIGKQIERFADEGLRTLGVARRRHRNRLEPFDGTAEHDLEWLGLIGMSDPPRLEAADVIERARRAGIRTVMLTGDHPRTAAAIGSSVGLSATHAPVTGAQLDDVDWSNSEEARATIQSTDVFARVAPEHKLELVRAMQRDGHIVAMTGDGVNDAPALRRADIGVAMGDVGTDVAREASDMVLADDDFATIVTAIEEGRNIFADIRKFLRYLLASNAGEVLVMVIGVLAAGPLGLRLGDGLAVPLLATQILWINLLTDSALALALGVDPSVEEVMDQPPRHLTDPIVDRSMWVTIVVVGTVTAVAGLVALDLELAGGLLGGDGDLKTARTMVFTTIVLAQVFNAFNARSDRVSAFVKLFDNRLLWAAVAATVSLQVAVVHIGLLNRAFETTPLTFVQWATCWGLAASVLVADELRKLIGRRVATRSAR
jgi:Ca2+-transporting ATPase